MYKHNAILGILISVILVVSCNNDKETSTNPSIQNYSNFKKENDSCAYYLKQCKILDDTILKSTEYNEHLVIKANNTFVKYALLCNNDSLSPEYLFKAAQLSQTLNKIEMSEKYLKKIIQDYPKSKLIPAVKFLLAEYYADVNLLNQPQKAKELFNNIIKEYPHTVWAQNAAAALQWIGKSDEELLKELKQKNH